MEKVQAIIGMHPKLVTGKFISLLYSFLHIPTMQRKRRDKIRPYFIKITEKRSVSRLGIISQNRLYLFLLPSITIIYPVILFNNSYIR